MRKYIAALAIVQLVHYPALANANAFSPAGAMGRIDSFVRDTMEQGGLFLADTHGNETSLSEAIGAGTDSWRFAVGHPGGAVLGLELKADAASPTFAVASYSPDFSERYAVDSFSLEDGDNAEDVLAGLAQATNDFAFSTARNMGANVERGGQHDAEISDNDIRILLLSLVIAEIGLVMASAAMTDSAGRMIKASEIGTPERARGLLLRTRGRVMAVAAAVLLAVTALGTAVWESHR